MTFLDSRRLTGPNLLWDREGAVLDVSLVPETTGAAIETWRREARRLLDAVGWTGEETTVRRFQGGASLAVSAPVDALYAATEVNEAAWEAATASLRGETAPDPQDVVERLRAAIERERNPALLALRAAAEARSVAFLSDDEQASVGLGIGSLAWPVNALPRPEEVPWDQVQDIPVVLVTGTNGKTTTVRLLAAMVRAAGLTAGITSTDRVEVGGEIIDHGDFSGPEGARLVLRDRRVELAILETARGGILRRGLPVRRADVALVTNVAADHLGEQGIGDLDSLADTKMVVTRVVGPEGHVVLNADDPLLIARAGRTDRIMAHVVWFSLDPERSPVHQRLGAEETAWVLRGGELERWYGGWKQRMATVDEIPIAFSGAARHNVANALAALAAGSSLLLPDEAMLRGLRYVRGTPEDNPGRGNLIELDNVKILLDYAHNPHGLAAVLGIAANLTARRRLVLLGQAGDRDDASIRELARAAWRLSPDRVVIKELPEMLRGRQLGEVPAILEDEIRKLGAGDDKIGRATTEIEAVRQALAWARKGDLLLLLVHTQRNEVLALLDRLREGGWEAGQPVGR